MSEYKQLEYSPYRIFSRELWAKLRADTPMTLDEADLEVLSGINVQLNMDEVSEIYLPMSRLLNFHVAAAQELHKATSHFLAQKDRKTPFIIGVAGSVAVGKSTSARVLQALLARWPNHPRVDLLPTDGFLYPNKELEERGIMNRKGFPESFDVARLLHFLGDVKAGRSYAEAPVYSHFSYDIVPDKKIAIERPDILIVEGLNVLQPAGVLRNEDAGEKTVPFVSDFFDFSIYIDAAADIIEQWYLQRFMRLRSTAFRDPAAYFHRYSKLTEDEAVETALNIWRSINLKNLRENILPTRQRADLILRKGANHLAKSVALRKL